MKAAACITKDVNIQWNKKNDKQIEEDAFTLEYRENLEYFCRIHLVYPVNTKDEQNI